MSSMAPRAIVPQVGEIRAASLHAPCRSKGGHVVGPRPIYRGTGRIMTMAVTASFSAPTLTVTGDALDNAVTVSRNAAGTILVNSGAVAVSGTPPTVANT